jgi:hypothetical protein
MRNLVLTTFSAESLAGVAQSTPPSLASDAPSDRRYLLDSEGHLVVLEHGAYVKIVDIRVEDAYGWFSSEYILDINCVVCLAHSGHIVTVNAETHAWEEEGCVEHGVRAGSWSPDQLRLLLVTDNNTLVLLSSCFDAMQEITLPRLPRSDACISWRGDGDYFAVYFTPPESSAIPCVHVYSNRYCVGMTFSDFNDD